MGDFGGFGGGGIDPSTIFQMFGGMGGGNMGGMGQDDMGGFESFFGGGSRKKNNPG